MPALYDHLLTAISSHRVGDRPNRYEPRAIKRRPNLTHCAPWPETKPNAYYAKDLGIEKVPFSSAPFVW